MKALIDAAELDVEPIWATVFAKALAGKNVNDMIANVGSVGAVAAPAGGASAAAGGAAAAEEKKEEKKEAEEESDDDMGFGGLF